MNNILELITFIIWFIISIVIMTFILGYASAHAQTSSDNEIYLNQSGDTITLNINQIGYGNKFGGSVSSGVVATDLTLTGSSLDIDLTQDGNSNQFLGSIIFDNSFLDFTTTGDTNILTLDIGSTGSADDSNLFLDFTGDNNTLDLNIGSVASAERLDFDLNVIGGSNIFDVDIEADDVTWQVDITGSGNDFLSNIKDGAYNSLTIDFTGDNGDIDINQWSGSCPQGVTSCFGVIDATINSDNAIIQINQKDTVE